ncbi:MAG: transcriptional regulator [Candidatus Lambdaproteobacteria bacterium RIFOXYD12_FULL_49_8]|uniref:Transcriptional regulator n=1 Tax=Candidatus Lambdaproteobacteria bacterium RIFOXYD2_FULL_50_16 TaxID=1817772 RepID=A0A1F6GBC1_9PROT|nr:MAG: transcriptional regulator [Candidatus Lambdaproteobacteria bacterium RIFOXYD2_FULL_50_16]OGG97323.1 MAG: transcriptional regulator [Candidatus Lambdaproteobacteria bacterium RIFOXYD12_FULL_49_8]
MEADPSLVKQLEALFDDQEDNIDKAVRCLKVLAHPQRLKILCVLQTGEHSVQQLEAYVGIAQATLSQHLSLLKDRGILTSRRQGNFSLYSVANHEMVDLFAMIQRIFCTETH